MAKKIMFVDDSPEILMLFTSAFKRYGYEVLTSEESTTALEMLSTVTPDVFVLDVMMPEINGIELCQLIRNLHEHKQTPIIIVSAYSDSGIVEQTFAAGANDYIFKPIDPKALEAKVQHLLSVAEG